jgi:hypothetical protein
MFDYKLISQPRKKYRVPPAGDLPLEFKINNCWQIV